MSIWRRRLIKCCKCGKDYSFDNNLFHHLKEYILICPNCNLMHKVNIELINKKYEGLKKVDKLYLSTPTGGTITYIGNKTIHAFLSNGTFTVPADMSGNVSVLIVAGAGGGGQSGSQGGGGGAGGLVYKVTHAVTAQGYSIVIGAGAAVETNGNNSTFDGLTAVGGGAGKGYDMAGSNGGSGGGAGTAHPTPPAPSGGTGTQTAQGGDSGTYGFGNDGGIGSLNLGYAGGGGGAGAVGSSGNPSTGGAGKDYSSEFGTDYGVSGVFAKGGNGCTPSTPGAGGAGGANTGNGGAGDWATYDNSRIGGSGIVIISYVTADFSGAVTNSIFFGMNF